MTHRGKRSREATLRRSTRRQSRDAHIKRTAARIVSTNAHRDTDKAESVNILTSGQVLKNLIDKLPKQRVSDLLKHKDMFTKGEVIADSYGKGSQQRMSIE